MKKIILLSMLVIGLFLISCGSNLPPEPGAPGTTGEGALAGQAVEGAEQYAEPTTFDLTPERLEIEEGSVGSITSTVREENYVYKNCYFYTPSEGWIAFELEGTDPMGNWFAESASKTVDISSEDIPPGENLVVCYACSWDDIINDWDCHGNKWMLRQFEIEIVPGLCITDEDCDGLACNPIGECVECTGPGYCGEGFTCEAERCMPVECMANDDCTDNQYCSSYNECLEIGLPDEPSAPPTEEIVPVEDGPEAESEAGLASCIDSNSGFISGTETSSSYIEYDLRGYTLPLSLWNAQLVGEDRYRVYDLKTGDGVITQFICRETPSGTYGYLYQMGSDPCSRRGLAILEDENGAYCG